MANHQHHPSIVLPLSLSIIFGSFTLGFYVAIQGPTLMDLIDLLHVNNDIMSHSLAVASLAYSVGGLLSGLLFNYVDRQILIPGYYIIFGLSNIITPYITNYYVFSVITVFKMMCAGGTDCGANVWILDMWPGKDAWLQALHFSFAVGCALGPLVVEPFLGAGEHRDGQGTELSFTQGSALINGENTESRIYIPYAVSGSANLLAAFFIVFLYFLESKRRRADAARAAGLGDASLVSTCPLGQPGLANHHHLHLSSGGAGKQNASTGEQILMSAVQHPAAIEAGLGRQHLQQAAGPPGSARASPTLAVPDTIQEEEGAPLNPPEFAPAPAAEPETAPEPEDQSSQPNQQQQQERQAANKQEHSQPTATTTTTTTQANTTQTSTNTSANANLQIAPSASNANLASSKPSLQLADFDTVKFTSKAKEGDGRPPYYVMLAIALSALCLSFYCGIEITSMNYLATFAVNIDLQLPKSSAALMSSALTISFAVGRLFGIWIAAYMRPHKLFYLCSAVMALGNVFILIFANTTEMFLWASVCLFGIGCGPMYASIVSFYDDKISKVTNTVSGIFILGSMFNVALNTLIIGHYIIDNALILIVCNLIGAVLLLCLFGSLHALTRIKKNQRKRKFKLQQLKALGGGSQLKQQATSDKTEPVAVAPATATAAPVAQAAAAVAVAAGGGGGDGGGGGGGGGGGHSGTTHQEEQEQQVALLNAPGDADSRQPQVSSSTSS